jgi:hypothetical protein
MKEFTVPLVQCSHRRRDVRCGYEVFPVVDAELADLRVEVDWEQAVHRTKVNVMLEIHEWGNAPDNNIALFDEMLVTLRVRHVRYAVFDVWVGCYEGLEFREGVAG